MLRYPNLYIKINRKRAGLDQPAQWCKVIFLFYNFLTILRKESIKAQAEISLRCAQTHLGTFPLNLAPQALKTNMAYHENKFTGKQCHKFYHNTKINNLFWPLKHSDHSD